MPKVDNKFTTSLQYVKENVKNVDFLLVDKHLSFLQSDTIILGVLGQAYGHVTKNNKFGISLQHLKKEVNDFFFNWDSLHARLNSHYKAWRSYKKKKHKKMMQLIF